MGTVELIDKILADARSRVAAIKEEKERRLEEIHNRTAAVLAELKKENEEMLNQKVNFIVERTRSQARLESRKLILEARWQMIERVCAEARKAIINDPDYPALLEMLVKKYVKPGCTVHLSPSDTARWKTIGGIKPGEPVPITGGVIIRTGREVIDLSLDTVLNQVREELITELAQTLFSGEQG